MAHLNSVHATIKFEPGESINSSTRVINFLVLTLYTMQSHQLPLTPIHPSHISANIPYSLAYRLKRIDGASLPGEDSI